MGKRTFTNNFSCRNDYSKQVPAKIKKNANFSIVSVLRFLVAKKELQLILSPKYNIFLQALIFGDLRDATVSSTFSKTRTFSPV